MWETNDYLRQTGLTVAVGPDNRNEFLQTKLALEGLSGTMEDPHAAYCALSLTSTPDLVKDVIRNRQNIVMEILRQAGITAYDPGSAPLSPDVSLTVGPDIIYRTDLLKIAASRFFVTNDLLPSTGVGTEMQAARDLNRISVVLHDRGIRSSRMQPSRTIRLSYDNLIQQAGEIIDVFRFLRNFEPGMGLENGMPVLLGFTGRKKVVNLEETVYNRFPNLKYEYDGTQPMVNLQVSNPGIFYEKIQ